MAEQIGPGYDTALLHSRNTISNFSLSASCALLHLRSVNAAFAAKVRTVPRSGRSGCWVPRSALIIGWRSWSLQRSTAPSPKHTTLSLDIAPVRSRIAFLAYLLHTNG